MNDEIKEILDAWKNKKYILAYTFNYDSAREQNDKLLDYITNLQQEIKELKEDKSKMFETAVKRNNQLLDRIDKAIEYLGIDEDILKTCEIYDVNGIEVYKILQGVDKE